MTCELVYNEPYFNWVGGGYESIDIINESFIIMLQTQYLQRYLIFLGYNFVISFDSVFDVWVVNNNKIYIPSKCVIYVDGNFKFIISIYKNIKSSCCSFLYSDNNIDNINEFIKNYYGYISKQLTYIKDNIFELVNLYNDGLSDKYSYNAINNICDIIYDYIDGNMDWSIDAC